MKGKSGLVKKILLCLYFLVATALLRAETENLNYYYKYPFSFGLGYQQLIIKPPPELNYDFFLFDLGLNMRTPLVFFPYLQPGLRSGIIYGHSKVDIESSTREPDHDLYTHMHIYALGGLHLVYRFSKNFEAGLFGYAGVSRGFFPYIDSTEKDVLFQNYLLGEAGLQFTIIPQYNFSLDIQPILRFQKTVYGAFTALDGRILAINCTFNFRMREDPDLQKRMLKSIAFEDISVPAAFAALQNYYSDNPLGYMTITNTEKILLEDVRISFFQSGYMDSPTPARSIAVLKPGESCQVPLYAVFNQAVMETEGMLPLNGEIILTYKLKGRQGEQTTSVVYNLHDKTSLTWDDDRKVAAFVTPADTVLRDYGSQIQQAAREIVSPLFNQPLQAAMQVYNALAGAGCFYQEDSVSPYALVKEDAFAVDSVQLPRETLKRQNGDCDDLTVLFLSLLEARGIETGFITIPGHIYPAFNTGLPPEDYRKIHPERNMGLIYQGQIWIPVEVTQLGSEDFLQAWYSGIRQYLQYNDRPQQRKVYVTRGAQQLYNPLSLRQLKEVTIDPPAESLPGDFSRDLEKLEQLIITDHRQSVADNPGVQNYLALGKILATFAHEEEAVQAFNQVLVLDPASPFPRIYMGNLRFHARDYTGALEYYNHQLEAFTAAGEDSGTLYLRLLLRISISHYMLGDLATARDYYTHAYDISPEQTRSYTYLAGNFSHSTRGSRQSIFNLYSPFAEESEEQ